MDEPLVVGEWDWWPFIPADRPGAELLAVADQWMTEFEQYVAAEYALDDIVVMDEFGELSCLTAW